jgi:glycosyltransferase involved in cell wall biosynthesis
MRILHLTTEFPPVIYGGLGTAVGGLVEASANAGMTVGVLLFGQTAGPGYGKFVPLPETATNTVAPRLTAGATIFEVSWFQGIESLAQTVAMWQPDVLHLHSFWLWQIAQALRDRLGKPLVYTVHSLDRAEYELGQGPPECLTQWVGQETVIRDADRVIALTRSERELLKQYCPGVEERVRVVGNGIQEIAIAPQAKEPDQDAPIVLFSGRFVERKGIRELIEAICIVLAEAPAVRFVLTGGHRHCTGAQMESWLLPARLYPHRAQINFTGWLTPWEMATWYRAADILVVPSWYEPFGMVILEGMLHGLAVAASAVGGPAEILDHGRTGVLFAPRDAAALAEAVLGLANDPDDRVRIAEAGARDVREKWLWPRIVEKMRRVYEELVPGARHVVTAQPTAGLHALADAA